jgi:hypothetical protein
MAINFSIYFGYLVVAYLVGRELTGIQATVFSVAYSVLVLAATVQIFIDLSVINALQSILLGSEVPFGYAIFQISVLVVLWALTVIYMTQRRRTAGA